MSFTIRNTASEVKVIARVGNVRRNESNGQKVANISVAVQRSWQQKENGQPTGEFQHVTQWYELACWAFNADKTENIEKGDVVECTFNLADVKPASYTKEGASEPTLSLKVARASVLLLAKKDTNPSAAAQDDEPVDQPELVEEAI